LKDTMVTMHEGGVGCVFCLVYCYIFMVIHLLVVVFILGEKIWFVNGASIQGA